jgi:hypothetical protein
MSKTLLLNDTSKYHYGCAEVVKTFLFDDSIETNGAFPEINFEDYDTVILNGEGTMHHTKNQIRQNPIKFLKLLKQAQQAGCNTQIVNTVWQEMTNEYDDVLKQCNKIEVREILSRKDLEENHGVESQVVPDRSLLTHVEYAEYPHVTVYQGRWFFNGPDLGHPKIDIFAQPWHEVVNRLRHCDLLVTGRHHEAYAAIKAGCKFIVLPGNTHKNEGIYLNAGVQPINKLDKVSDVLNGKYDNEFEQIKSYYEQL